MESRYFLHDRSRLPMSVRALVMLGVYLCGFSVSIGQRRDERRGGTGRAPDSGAGPVYRAVHRGPMVIATFRDARRSNGGVSFDVQPGPMVPVRRQGGPDEACRRVFGSIERGIGQGLVEAFAPHFAGEVSITLPGGGSGTYSARQAGLVLESFFKTRRLSGFRFTTFGESDANPYATGSVAFNLRGSRMFAQVYVSLSQSGGRWVITQMNIY